jgi:hypothetical protein
MASVRLIDLAICLSAGAVSILWFECLKVFRRGRALAQPIRP